MRSLGLATDLLALRGLARIERHPDHIVVRTPDQPNFWSGNLILSLGEPLSPEDEVARFRAAFPEASHVTVAWDDPNLDPEPLRGPWEALGAEIGTDDVLSREGPPPPCPLPGGYAIRELDPASDRDWAESLRVALTVGVGEGYEEASHRPFLQRRILGRRTQARAGTLRWWGVFRDGDLAAQMGLVEGEVDGRPLARFQDVDTHPDHRRRGLCAALLSHVGAAARAPTLVIVAEPEGDAGRIYRRAGFEPVERVVAAQRRGY
jgi:GNAT superfamily N-acetyltransferase